MKTVNIFLLILSLTVFTSCKTILYTANTPSIPLFTNKNQIKAEVGYGVSGIEPKISYSPIKHLSILGNGSFLSNKERKQYFREFGVGGYGTLDNNFVFEFYTGYGTGTSSDTAGLILNTSTFSRTSYGEYERFFIQGNMGYYSENFEGGIALRFSNLNYYHLRDNFLPVTDSRAWFFEPSIAGKVGSKNIKFIFSMTFPTLIGNPPLFGYDTFIISAGIQGMLDF